MVSRYFYSIPVHKSGWRYFPSGHRQGSFLRFKDYWAESAPLAACPKSRNHFSYLQSMARWHGRLKCAVVSPKTVVFQSGLVNSSNFNEALKTALRLKNLGYSCLKVKIHGEAPKKEAKKINLLANKLGDLISLRLDFNKKYSLNEMREFLTVLQPKNIEYLEEPLTKVTDIKTLRDYTNIPIAVDESFVLFPYFSFFSSLGINYVVIKPSLFSCIGDVVYLIKKIRKMGGNAIISTCFESEFTACFYSILLAKLGLLNHHHALFMEGFLKRNPKCSDVLGARVNIFRAWKFLQTFSPFDYPQAFNEGL